MVIALAKIYMSQSDQITTYTKQVSINPREDSILLWASIDTILLSMKSYVKSTQCHTFPTLYRSHLPWETSTMFFLTFPETFWHFCSGVNPELAQPPNKRRFSSWWQLKHSLAARYRSGVSPGKKVGISSYKLPYCTVCSFLENVPRHRLSFPATLSSVLIFILTDKPRLY